jgi:peptidoglycan hydrolase CwlO-like protein
MLIRDIKKKEARLYKEQSTHRVNLNKDVVIRIPAKKIFISAILSFAIIFLLLGAAYAPISHGYLLAASNTDTQRAAYEAQLKDLEDQIAQDEKTIAQYSSQGKSLQSEISRLNAKISQMNLQIKAITLTLKDLNGQITDTQNQVTKTEGDITSQTEYLGVILQTVYENEKTNIIEVMLANPKLSDFFLDINNLIAVQDNARITLQKIIQLKSDLMNQKEVLASEYGDAQQLQAYQLAQQQSAKQTATEKSSLLQITKGQESKYQQLVAQKQKTAAQIRSQLYELIGGGELQFGEAYRLAKIAQDSTGVRAAMILAVLDRESALGRNVGKCKYNVNPYYPDQASNKTTMHPTRDIPVFLQIMQSLNMSPDSVYVSCPIPRDGAYGGGMGPAQFIPSTWALYEDQIAASSGHNPPSPWNNLDAFIATALYLKDAGASNASTYNEKVAAAKYYAGGNWRNYINTYGAAVISKAADFQSDIDVLNG